MPSRDLRLQRFSEHALSVLTRCEYALIDTQRLWITCDAGYSSKSTAFLAIDCKQHPFRISFCSDSLVDRLHDQLCRLLGHPCMHKARKIERRVAVEVHLVVQELVRTPTWDTDVRQLILGYGRCILISRPCLMQVGARVTPQVLSVRMFSGLLNDGVSVDWKYGYK